MSTVLILLGPTGVGKTEVSILLAKALDTDIISADSMQIYRHMDIGTAKPTPEQRAEVTHHMIDIIDPRESFSTGKYIEAVLPIIDGLVRKGKTPIIVGGTGLYIKAMTRGIFSGPSADWSLREELRTLEEEEPGTLYSHLRALDPEAVQKITPNDTRRIIRALEVCLKSKRPVSDIQKRLTKPLPYEFLKIGLSRDRSELYRIIEDRVDHMVASGLIDEVRRVSEIIRDAPQHSCPDNVPLPSMQAIGYKEFSHYLNGEMSLDNALRLVKKASKRYAKRQFTWFRKEEGVHWVDITGIFDSHTAFDRVNKILRALLT